MKKQISEMIAKAETELKNFFSEIDSNEEIRTRRVLEAFREEGVSYRHFAPTTGILQCRGNPGMMILVM